MAAPIQIIEERGAGASSIRTFAILPDRVEDAATHLIELLAESEISLMNNEDEGGEGCTTIRSVRNGFECRNGGHGWQSEWKLMNLDELRARIIELAPQNNGGHWSKEGSIRRANVG